MKTKEKAKTKNIILQDRDYEVLRYILEQKFLSREQIEKWFYKSQDMSRNRLWQLMFSGYLKKQLAGDYKKDNLLITYPGVRVLAEKGLVNNGLRPVGWINTRFYFHDKKVTDIRLLFEEIGLAKDWKSERVLWSECVCQPIVRQEKREEYDAKVPDGVFVSPGGKRIALEFEFTPKENYRYKKILKGYLGKHSVDRTFWVVTGGALLERLRELFEKEGYSSKMLICKLEDLEKDPIRAEVFWGKQKTTIKELIDAR